MKTLSCFMWVLIALLVAATLDRVPDPPAANPSSAQLTVSGVHEPAPAFGAAAVAVPLSQAHEPGYVAISDTAELPQSNRWIDALERGTDPSPPVFFLLA